ncbi:MAG TPA: SLC13 family permease [Ohtaekwangia sp.]|nr:SLC13 family permease [Ohtaekwangia sp.]
MKTYLDKPTIKLLLLLLPPLIVLAVPTASIPIDNLTLVEHRVLALFLFAALFWIFEPIPIYATSMLIIVIELLFLSDTSILFAKSEGPLFGQLLPYKDIMATLASPVIVLFLGGFFLAAAATKYRLDQNISRVLLKRLGENPRVVLLGIMSVTAAFSMFMSNTATTAMMLSILIPVLKMFPANDKGRIAFVLAIPIAANLGGIGTPIGTPPNAIALKFINATDPITFGQWMAFGVPFVIVTIILAWLLLIFLFSTNVKSIRLTLEGTFSKSKKSIIVYATFFVTIALWLLDFAHGVNSYAVAMIPVAVFLSTGIINKEDLKSISWEVLWLVSGGIALGLAIEKTGLASNLINSIPFASLGPYMIIALAAITGFFMANFMSHTASANLLIPLIAALGTSVSSLEAIGGSRLIVLAATFAISLGMSLPISSPPNALAHATGEFQTKDLVKVGFGTGVIGLFVTALLMMILHALNYFA